MGQIPLELGWDAEIDQLWDRVVEAYGEATAIQAMERTLQAVPLQTVQGDNGDVVQVRVGSRPHSRRNCNGYTGRTERVNHDGDKATQQQRPAENLPLLAPAVGPHDWHFNFKPRGGRAWRFSLDVELGRRLKNKEEAKAEAENIRTAIRAGTFVRSSERQRTAATATTPDSISLTALRNIYVERRGTPLRGNDAGCRRQFLAFGGLGTKVIGALTEDDIEAFFADLRTKGRAVSTRSKYVQAIKGLFRWAVKRGYLQRNPVDADTIKRGKHAKRNRRLTPDVVNADGAIERESEERRLLAVAGQHLQRLVIAALESCCRLGELLTLTWADVDLTRKELTVRPRRRRPQQPASFRFQPGDPESSRWPAPPSKHNSVRPSPASQG